jgi:hypothetical protein
MSQLVIRHRRKRQAPHVDREWLLYRKRKKFEQQFGRTSSLMFILQLLNDVAHPRIIQLLRVKKIGHQKLHALSAFYMLFAALKIRQKRKKT